MGLDLDRHLVEAGDAGDLGRPLFVSAGEQEQPSAGLSLVEEETVPGLELDSSPPLSASPACQVSSGPAPPSPPHSPSSAPRSQ